MGALLRVAHQSLMSGGWMNGAVVCPAGGERRGRGRFGTGGVRGFQRQPAGKRSLQATAGKNDPLPSERAPSDAPAGRESSLR
jgi:hypothetical protein